jgi:hypothetical protein
MHSQLNHLVAKQEHARIVRSAELRALTANRNASRSTRPSTARLKQLRGRINAAFSLAIRGSARNPFS